MRPRLTYGNRRGKTALRNAVIRNARWQAYYNRGSIRGTIKTEEKQLREINRLLEAKRDHINARIADVERHNSPFEYLLNRPGYLVALVIFGFLCAVLLATVPELLLLPLAFLLVVFVGCIPGWLINEAFK